MCSKGTKNYSYIKDVVLKSQNKSLSLLFFSYKKCQELYDLVVKFYDLMFVWIAYFLPVYFTIQLIFSTIHYPIVLFDTIHKSHCTTLANFYLYLQYFQQKNFNFNKISESQTDP